ncbi:putative mitochondrial import receptor subunit [Ascodesmis nigricans]|uniref:Mitochondrial import receptor subunit TOM20 n=1 Tax=Ascodesmis nigricans TaxID=341454 RepID=A0A4S2MPT0_9PEZI|nr:putative mitochondrial import receptor subunit [Ascodesmis nigricans]
MVETKTVVLYTAAAAIALGTDAAYFDYKRRTDPNFRKSIRREKKRHVKAQKAEAEAANAHQRQEIQLAVRQAQVDGFPTDVEEKEAYFMNEVARGEALCADPSTTVDAALCFYKALKVYPNPSDLISIYDKTVPKHVLDVLAQMLAIDHDIPTIPHA